MPATALPAYEPAAAADAFIAAYHPFVRNIEGLIAFGAARQRLFEGDSVMRVIDDAHTAAEQLTMKDELDWLRGYIRSYIRGHAQARATEVQRLANEMAMFNDGYAAVQWEKKEDQQEKDEGGDLSEAAGNIKGSVEAFIKDMRKANPVFDRFVRGMLNKKDLKKGGAVSKTLEYLDELLKIFF